MAGRRPAGEEALGAPAAPGALRSGTPPPRSECGAWRRELTVPPHPRPGPPPQTKPRSPHLRHPGEGQESGGGGGDGLCAPGSGSGAAGCPRAPSRPFTPPAPPRESASDPAAMLGRIRDSDSPPGRPAAGQVGGPPGSVSAPEGRGRGSPGGAARVPVAGGRAQVAAAPAPPPPRGGAGSGAGGARSGDGAGGRGAGAREFPPPGVTSLGSTALSSLPPGAGTRRWKEGEGPVGLASARRRLPTLGAPGAATHASTTGGQVRTGRGPAGGGGRPRPGSVGPGARPPAPGGAAAPRPRRLRVGKLRRNFSPPPTRPVRRACLLPDATCSPPASVSAPSVPFPPDSDLRCWERWDPPDPRPPAPRVLTVVRAARRGEARCLWARTPERAAGVAARRSGSERGPAPAAAAPGEPSRADEGVCGGRGVSLALPLV